METDTIFIRKLNETIHQNLDNPNLNGELIAQKLGINRMQLYRKLKQLTNQSATEYINTIRIDYAKEQLQNTSKFVYQVATECGFTHYTYFSKLFKQKTGYSPTEYRKQ